MDDTTTNGAGGGEERAASTATTTGPMPPPPPPASASSSPLAAIEAPTAPLSSDLPFLVTHWLAHYRPLPSDDAGGKRERRSSREGTDGNAEALAQIRRAASDLASAFASLGAFGTALRSPLGLPRGTSRTTAPYPTSSPHIAPSTGQQDTTTLLPSTQPQHPPPPLLRNATYADLARRWSSAVPPGRLHDLVRSGTSATVAAVRDASVRSQPRSFLDAAHEGSVPVPPRATAGVSGVASMSASGRGDIGEGRRIGERASHNDDDDEDGSGEHDGSPLQHPPALLAPPRNSSSSSAAALDDSATYRNDDEITQWRSSHSSPPERRVRLVLASDRDRSGIVAAESSRRYLSLRLRFEEKGRDVASVRRSLASARERASREAAAASSVAAASIAPAGQSGTATSVKISSAAAAALVPPVENGTAATATVATSAATASKGELNAERVIAQLERRLEELESTRSRTKAEADAARIEADGLHRSYSALCGAYCDPFGGRDRKEEDGRQRIGLPHCAVGRGGPPAAMCALAQQYGGGLNRRQRFGRVPTVRDARQRPRSVLKSRLSHAVTVSCHLIYPVYCLRFDRTGRYFVTGADDQLVKLFHLGSAASPCAPEDGRLGFNYGANARGAVLVCTLRGHAAVITDIDVSADNALLATASEDGDCRIWGLRDGCPVAILRGHRGGVNMVRWSVLTPYRIVTTGEDGLARIWDVREAALKRYGSEIGDRSDYLLPKRKAQINKETALTADEGDAHDINAHVDAEDEVALPPLPVRGVQQQGGSGGGTAAAVNVNAISGSNNNDGSEIFVPPLPPGAEGLGIGALGGQAGQGENGQAAPGSFVANDSIDEGVRLISKLQHGDVISEDQHHGPSTRSRRKAVKVICLARCPVGGHFATGSDDGLGRIWADEDDYEIEELDEDARESSSVTGCQSMTCLLGSWDRLSRKGARKSGSRSSAMLNPGGDSGNVAPSKSTLLATLPGHLNSITDIQYSNAGDRILTASQKDGVVRIWAWGKESPLSDASHKTNASDFQGNVGTKFTKMTQILIRLTAPSQSNSGGSSSSATARPSSSRRRGGLSSNSSSNQSNLGVSCDIAVWTADDASVVTSQSCPLKATGNEIVPGSQILYVWDSHSGQCLMGILASHAAPCPVLVPHPFLPSILASAGADGNLNVWDLDIGRSFCSHKNTAAHGPVEPPTDRGKPCGYLDGSFSPDGLHLVLTDDNGRVTILDSLAPPECVKGLRSTAGDTSRPLPLQAETGTASRPIRVSNRGTLPSSSESAYPPAWMKEQYFANDYYDLFYDANGYCIERGSEQPPHLAPRAARCDHSGTPYPDIVNASFSKIVGPAPLLERQVRCRRDVVRSFSVEVRKEGGLLSQNAEGKKNVFLAQSGSAGYGSTTTAIFLGTSALVQTHAAETQASPTRTTPSFPSSPSGGGQSRSNARSTSTGRSLSNRYSWRDYDDVLREEEANDEEDNDDEEYEDSPRRSSHGRSAHSDHSGSSGSSDEDDEGDSARRASRSSRSSSRRASEAGHGRRLGGRRRDSTQSRSQRQRSRGSARDQSVAFEEHLRQQPTRMSSRQAMSQRRAYEVPESSDEEFEELLSTNTTPSGEFIEDYTVLGHYFRMPLGSIVHRAWLCRTENLCGRKVYSPQVGDSVVYIPRAHYDTIQAFPNGSQSAPWKSWPTSSAWPVVRCTISDVRYRFPYENYYRNRHSDEQITSVVAILTLEVTGIPEISTDHIGPWPKPAFISRRTRSSSISFEVTMFESDQADFVIPEYLYQWKLKSLEAAMRRQNGDPNGLEAVAYYADDEASGEDLPLVQYPCEIVGLSDPVDEDEFHFQNSGYNALAVKWPDSDGEPDPMCTWDITMSDQGERLPPCPSLSEEVKVAVKESLRKIEQNPDVQEWFLNQVDTRRYADYLNMIEVPMYVSFMQKRHAKGYYTNKLSVLADMKLIRDNCIKYNDANSDLAEKARRVYNEFKEMIDEIDDSAVSSSRQQQRTEEAMQTRTSYQSQSAAGSTGETAVPPPAPVASREHQASSLENLPAPISNEEMSDASTGEVGESGLNARGASPTAPTRHGRPSSHRTPEQENHGDSPRTPSGVEDSDEEENRSSGGDDDDKDDDKDDEYEVSEDDGDNDSSDYSAVEEDAIDDDVVVQRKGRRRASGSRASRSKRRTRAKRPAKSSRCTNVQNTRSSPRKRTRGTPTYQEVDSDEFIDDDEEEDDEEEEEVSSDEGEGSLSESSDDYEPSSKKTRGGATKRRKATSRGGGGAAKRSKRETRGGYLYLPDLARWPSVVKLKDITKIATSIIERLEANDYENLFATPVAEDYPQLADAYLAMVKEPMDFRTIVEDRLPAYDDIASLQDDLILVFRNCCTYNGEGHEYYHYAVNIWSSLNDIFREICEEEGIRLPRSW